MRVALLPVAALWKGDIDYSHRPKLGADEKVRIGWETIW